MSIRTTQPAPDFYAQKGTMQASAPSYVRRAADNQLLEEVRRGHYCYVLTSRQMGKSSLMVRTSQQLRLLGARTSIVDLTLIGAHDIARADWYLGQLRQIARDLHLDTDVLTWWKDQVGSGEVERFVDFLRVDQKHVPHSWSPDSPFRKIRTSL